MKRNVIIVDLNFQADEFITKLHNQERIIYVKCNIYDLECLNDALLYLIEDNCRSFQILSVLLSKFTCINAIIINSTYPDKAMPCDQLTYDSLKSNICRNTVYVLEFINNILRVQNNLLITFFVHALHKKQFLIQNQIYNSFLINLMTTIVNESGLLKKIRVNCVATNNLKMVYQKNIYPYNSFINKKDSVDLFLLYKFLITSDISNKIVKF